MKIHPWKNQKMRPWKLWSAREKVEKSVRESDFSFREKSQKKAKKGFHGHFWFSREKKKRWPPPPNEYGQMVREYRANRENGKGIYGSLY